MKELIDFDSRFNDYIEEYGEKLLNEGKKPEEIEDLIPEMYEKWAAEASKYFDGMTNREFVEMLGAYMDEEMSVPDVLTEKISDLPECERGVYELFCQERTASEKMLLMNILGSMQSALPIKDYINIIRIGEDEEMRDAALEALRFADAGEQALEAYREEDGPEIKASLMYALVYGQNRTEGLAQELIKLIAVSSNKAVIAGMMSYYGDDECLPALQKAKDSEEISYIDYVEICDAIEALGGEVKREREFDGDPYYEMMQNGGNE